MQDFFIHTDATERGKEKEGERRRRRRRRRRREEGQKRIAVLRCYKFLKLFSANYPKDAYFSPSLSSRKHKVDVKYIYSEDFQQLPYVHSW